MERSHQIHVTQNTAACMNMLKTCTGLHVHVIDLIKQTVIATSSKSILEFAQMTMQKDICCCLHMQQYQRCLWLQVCTYT